ncbi:MAG: phosphatase PAP2 family protein [Pseudomonadota bacterium]
MSPLSALALWAACAMAGATGSVAAADPHGGDALRFALPAATVAAELARSDETAARQYAAALAIAVGAGEALKRATGIERPDRSNERSFPSGHAVWAFSPAASVHRRHGLAPAVPLYLAATYVGWTRVHAHRHRWADVAGAALLAAAVSWWLVEPRRSQPGAPRAALALRITCTVPL